jgi:hypothetical protein
MHQSREDRSLGELFVELAGELNALIRQEASLAKTEMSEKASMIGKDVGFLAAGGAIAYAGFLAILAAVVALLALIIPLWLSALIAGVVVAAVGYYLIHRGQQGLKKADLKPHETIETLKEDSQWLKAQA